MRSAIGTKRRRALVGVTNEGASTLAAWLDRYVEDPRQDLEEEILAQIVQFGETGDELLSNALRRLVDKGDSWSDYGATGVAAVLGDARGPDGVAALRQVLCTSGLSVDLRCATLLALAKRDPGSTGDALQALSSRQPTVKAYAMLCLAAIGDGRGWDEVFSRLRTILNRPTKPTARRFEVHSAVCYLASYMNDTADRVERLVDLLRSRWDRLHAEEVQWLDRYWPSVRPGVLDLKRVGVADTVGMRTNIRHPLFNGPAFPVISAD